MGHTEWEFGRRVLTHESLIFFRYSEISHRKDLSGAIVVKVLTNSPEFTREILTQQLLMISVLSISGVL